ncbi:uncharacterized protein LOC106644046 [Copidosoma floridanum]|uniref:uncharacterized protein LOC106644046 n=1 Tax=Copidosoma floridanum TaxID=29053 RepID=UPI0006C975DD|nr:uncharacterized protein LOC106644046 [Copidosoma floridanum]
MCCMSLTLAVKLIGTYGMSLSILMINMLISNFFSSRKEDKLIIALESWMLLGFNWTFVIKSMKVVETARMLLICVLIYSSLFLVANALMTLGSLLKKPDYLLPWMYMQMISIIDQTISLAVQLSSNDAPDKWGLYLPACSIYLVLSSYFWMLVSSARQEYMNELESESRGRTSTMVTSSPAGRSLRDSNVPKTPSYLSCDIAYVFDHPQPMIRPRNHEVV